MEETEILDLPDADDTTCSLCYAEFLDPEDLTIHINQVHANESEGSLVKCHFCTRSYRDLEAYAVHLRDIHLSGLKSCRYCNRVFNHFSEHKMHQQSHRRHFNKSLYYCSNCNSIFNNIAELEAHEYDKHKESDNGIFLNELFPLLSSLLNIKVTRFLQCLVENDVLYLCVNCEHSTPDVNNYIEHLSRKNCRSFTCNACYSVYKARRGLVSHFSAHQECHLGVTITKPCPECHKDIDIRTLKEHSKVCKPIKCKRCDIIFESIYDLTRHQTKLHPAVVHLEVCKYCNKDFAGGSALKKHIQRAHESQLHLYKYKCIYCSPPAIFKHPKNLFAHFFSTHKDVEPYTCMICDKKFRIRKSFTLHIKLDHKSIGFVEFDEKYHVFFRAQKSECPFNTVALCSAEKKDEIITETDGTIEGQTDVEGTDINKSLLVEQIEKPKNNVRFDVEEKDNSTNIKLVNVNSDFMSATETENNLSEAEIEKTSALKRKITRKRKRVETVDDVILSDSSDEDEPLLQVKNRVRKLHKNKMVNAARVRNLGMVKVKKGHKNKFICNICNKQCFTYQNYNNHVALHKNNGPAKCVKCGTVCKSKKALTEHYTREHSTSKLTETLKNILEKRKSLNNNNTQPVELSNNEKFKLTIQKVPITKSNYVATIKPVGEKSLSVQKFIESFTPESEPKREIDVESNLTIRRVNGQLKNTVIKTTKCKLDDTKSFNGKRLALPVPFKKTNEQHKVTVRVVTPGSKVSEDEHTNDYNLEEFDQDNYPEDIKEDNEQIPEVAQEIMLGGSEEPAPKTIFVPHKVVIPQLPTQCKKIHIAHLQPEAPYYKIVKIEEALNPKKKKKNEPIQQQRDIKLPDGTTLVSVNPLAHLLGNTPVEKILESTKSKHYQPKSKDFETAVAKAMLRLETNPKRGKKKNAAKNVIS